MPGLSLRAWLARGMLTPDMMRAAGAALARAHARAGEDGQPWSHGDLRLDGVLYDPETRRASLTGSGPAHLPGLSPDERHADDLLVLLLDLMGRTPDGSNLASAFLVSYGRPRIRRRLLGRLFAEPSLLETNPLGPEELGRRLEALRRCPPLAMV